MAMRSPELHVVSGAHTHDGLGPMRDQPCALGKRYARRLISLELTASCAACARGPGRPRACSTRDGPVQRPWSLPTDVPLQIEVRVSYDGR